MKLARLVLHRVPSSQRGTALIVAMLTLFVAITLAYSALSISTSQHKELQQAPKEMQAQYMAEAGVERAKQFARSLMDRSPFDPFFSLDAVLFDSAGDPTEFPYVIAQDEPVVKNGRRFGTMTVTMRGATDAGGRNLLIHATGYVPNAQNPVSKMTVEAVFRAELATSEIFDYGYFVNNRATFHGDGFSADGNVRANGEFDAESKNATVNGTPRYDRYKFGQLIGYHDDNRDSVVDGSDGGIYSGWDVARAESVQGMGGLEQNQHEFQPQLSMPNLNDLSTYETMALQKDSSIRLGQAGGLPPADLCDAVLGDESGEPQNLFLIGTPDEPIVLDGPVVVRGDVIIKGYVTGKGTIYAGGNVYIADDLHYLNGPADPLPPSNSQEDTEQWMAANKYRDFLGLFSRESIVLGDKDNSEWINTVGQWLDDPKNSSIEDAGIDGIPGTASGRDGIFGTEDDDVLEGDGLWTVEHYTEQDEALGLIPDGSSVGDPIPGTGEDIDGDGAFDDTIGVHDFDLDAPIDTNSWAGNLPALMVNYSDVASMEVQHIDGVLYTNHALAMSSQAATQSVEFYGALLSRNESLLYQAAELNVLYDRRLCGGGVYGGMLPRTLEPLRFLAWRLIDGGDVSLEIFSE